MIIKDDGVDLTILMYGRFLHNYSTSSIFYHTLTIAGEAFRYFLGLVPRNSAMHNE